MNIKWIEYSYTDLKQSNVVKIYRYFLFFIIYFFLVSIINNIYYTFTLKTTNHTDFVTILKHRKLISYCSYKTN